MLNSSPPRPTPTSSKLQVFISNQFHFQSDNFIFIQIANPNIEKLNIPASQNNLKKPPCLLTILTALPSPLPIHFETNQFIIIPPSNFISKTTITHPLKIHSSPTLAIIKDKHQCALGMYSFQKNFFYINNILLNLSPIYRLQSKNEGLFNNKSTALAFYLPFPLYKLTEPRRPRSSKFTRKAFGSLRSLSGTTILGLIRKERMRFQRQMQFYFISTQPPFTRSDSDLLTAENDRNTIRLIARLSSIDRRGSLSESTGNSCSWLPSVPTFYSLNDSYFGIWEEYDSRTYEGLVQLNETLFKGLRLTLACPSTSSSASLAKCISSFLALRSLSIFFLKSVCFCASLF